MQSIQDVLLEVCGDKDIDLRLASIAMSKYAGQFKDKADKWDELDNKLAEIYGDGDDDNEQETDLTDIGEIAATAFGYL